MAAVSRNEAGCYLYDYILYMEYYSKKRKDSKP